MTAALDAKPVIAMPHSVHDAGPNVIAVAVDGSHESRHALEWAVSHAESHRLAIRVVTTYSTPHAVIDYPMSIGALAVDAEKYAREPDAVVDGGIGSGHRRPTASPVRLASR
jgi:hypothetical protein